MTSKTAETSAPLLAERWGPRGFGAHSALHEQPLDTLLESARWARSANNSQPWRFLVARRGQEPFDRLAQVLVPGNRSWAPGASALLLVAAETADDTGRPRPRALYDTGQAVAALSVQAEALGLHIHQMGGSDTAGARQVFGLPENLQPVVVAVGRFDGNAELPEALAAREQAPRARLPLPALLLDPAAVAVAAA